MTCALSDNRRPDVRWQETLFEIGKERLASGLPLPDDDRVADYSYLLPLPAGRPLDALVIGGSWGILPARLAEWCRSVQVVSQNTEYTALLQQRILTGNNDGISVVKSSSLFPSAFGDERFDLVGYGGWSGSAQERISFRAFAAEAHRLLKRGGVFFCTIGNRWSLQRWLRKNVITEPFRLMTLFGYRMALRSAGFEAITAYGPLPRHDGIPLCFLPLGGLSDMQCFIDRVFPLFDMVSPESKRAYAIEYRLAKCAVKLGQLFHVTTLMKYFLSGFLLIAQKPERS